MILHYAQTLQVANFSMFVIINVASFIRECFYEKLIAPSIMIILIFMVYADKSNASQTWQPKAGENWIGINKEQLRLTLYNGQDLVKAWQISIGKGKGAEKNPVLTSSHLPAHSPFTVL